MADTKKDTTPPDTTATGGNVGTTGMVSEADSKQAKKDEADRIRKSQAAYNGGNEAAGDHSDLVKVKIIKDSDYYKEGDEDIVHPTTALIMQAKGLIEGTGVPYTRPEFKQKDITIDY